MAAFALSLFFVFFFTIYIFREFILKRLIPRMFSLGFLSVAFVLSGVLFSIVYFFLDAAVGNAIFRDDFYRTDVPTRVLNYLYFSFVSQLTIGYGDICPVHPLGKFLAIIQGMAGAVFMGGLIASLIELSKSTLNYLYISEFGFIHVDKESNHGQEVFNATITIVKSSGSVFGGFVFFLTSENERGERYHIIKKECAEINATGKIQVSINNKSILPRIISHNGTLAFETIDVANSRTDDGLRSKNLSSFNIHKLIIEYQYSFESRLYTKEISFAAIADLAKIFDAKGYRECKQFYKKH